MAGMLLGAGEVRVLVVVPFTIGAIDGVVQPLVEVTCRFAEGIVVSGYGPVEPCAIWVAGGHVVLVWAVEAVVGCVSTAG